MAFLREKYVLQDRIVQYLMLAYGALVLFVFSLIFGITILVIDHFRERGVHRYHQRDNEWWAE